MNLPYNGNLPHGVTNRAIEEAAGGGRCAECGEVDCECEEPRYETPAEERLRLEEEKADADEE